MGTVDSKFNVRTITIQRKQPGQSAQIPSKVRSRRTLEFRAAELEWVAELKLKEFTRSYDTRDMI